MFKYPLLEHLCIGETQWIRGELMLHLHRSDRNFFLLNWYFSPWDFHCLPHIQSLWGHQPKPPLLTVESYHIFLSCLFSDWSASSSNCPASGLILSPLTLWLVTSSFSLSLIWLNCVVQTQRWGKRPALPWCFSYWDLKMNSALSVCGHIILWVQTEIVTQNPAFFNRSC